MGAALAGLDVDIKFSISNPSEDSWKQEAGRSDGWRVRDLGIREATGGKVSYKVLRATKPIVDAAGWRRALGEIRVLHCLKGWGEIELDAGVITRIETGTTVSIPGGMPYNELRYSGDAELLELILGDTRSESCALPKAPSAAYRSDTGVRLNVTHFTKDSWKKGAGRRTFMDYWDFGVGAATGGRLDMINARASKGEVGQTGWHYHTIGLQVEYCIHGPTVFEFQAGKQTLFEDGTCICIPPLFPHIELSYPDNSESIGVSMGEFGTFSCAPPVG